MGQLSRQGPDQPPIPNIFTHEQNKIAVSQALRDSLSREGVHARSIDGHHFTPGAYGMLYFVKKTVALLDGNESGNSTFREDILKLATGKPFRGHKLYPARSNGDFLGKKGSMSYGDAKDYRTLLMNTYTQNPDTTEALVKNNIVGLHASGSATLLSSLRHGLLPLNKLRTEGHETPNGAKDGNKKVGDGTSFVVLGANKVSDGREFVSYTGTPITPESLDRRINKLSEFIQFLQNQSGHDRNSSEVAHVYAAINKLRDKKQFLEKPAENPEEATLQRLTCENFPVIWGLSSKNVRSKQLLPIISDVHGEFLVSGLKPHDTPVILVPRDKIQEVQQLVDKSGSHHTVLPIEDIPDLSAALDYEISMRAHMEQLRQSRKLS